MPMASIKPVVVLLLITVFSAANVTEIAALTLPIIGSIPTGQSTFFTGIYGYSVSVLWLLGGMLYGGCLLKDRAKRKYKLKPRDRPTCFNHYYLCLAFFFTLLALVASWLIIVADTKFDSQAKTVVNIIAEAAYNASESLYNITGAIKEIVNVLGTSNSSLADISSSTMADVSGFLAYTSDQLDFVASDIHMQAKSTRALFDKELNIAYVITTITIGVNLIAAVALAVSGLLRLRRAVYLLIIFCWFLTILCWLFFGLYFSINKFSGDMCMAMKNFQQNPYNNSMNSLLPCDELFSAQSALDSVGAAIYVLVNTVNSITEIQKITNRNASDSYVCNPFSGPPEYKYAPGNCSSGTIRIGDIPQVLRLFACSDSSNGTCTRNQFMSPSDIRDMETYSISVQTILNVYPDIENLVGCQPVKDAFSEIVLRHCEPMKRYVGVIWVGLVSLSLIMVLLVLLWTHQANYQEKLHSKVVGDIERVHGPLCQIWHLNWTHGGCRYHIPGIINAWTKLAQACL
ncbi:hypothetical protein ACFE04_004694 [Oxalis oulophora]